MNSQSVVTGLSSVLSGASPAFVGGTDLFATPVLLPSKGRVKSCVGYIADQTSHLFGTQYMVVGVTKGKASPLTGNNWLVVFIEDYVYNRFIPSWDGDFPLDVDMWLQLNAVGNEAVAVLLGATASIESPPSTFESTPFVSTPGDLTEGAA